MKIILISIILGIDYYALYSDFLDKATKAGNSLNPTEYAIGFLAASVAILMIIPLITRLVHGERLEKSFGNKVCLWNSIVIFFVSFCAIAVEMHRYSVIERNIDQIEYAFLGGIFAFEFYFINKWCFVSNEAMQGGRQPKHAKENGTEHRNIELNNMQESVTDTSEKRFCTNCGKQINNTWKFCNYCGNELKSEEPKKEKSFLNRSLDKTAMMEKLIKVMDITYYDSKNGFNENVPSKEEREKVKKEFYDFIIEDSTLGSILNQHNVTYDAFKNYLELMQSEGWGWANGRYIPVDVFSFAREMEYFLNAVEKKEEMILIYGDIVRNRF